MICKSKLIKKKQTKTCHSLDGLNGEEKCAENRWGS